MSVRAYVFIGCAPGRPAHVADALTGLPGVEMAHAVTGSYDAVAFVRAEGMAELGDLLSRRTHRLPGVLRTTTNVVVPGGAGRSATGSDRGRPA